MGIIRFPFKFEEQWWQKRAGIVYMQTIICKKSNNTLNRRYAFIRSIPTARRLPAVDMNAGIDQITSGLHHSLVE